MSSAGNACDDRSGGADAYTSIDLNAAADGSGNVTSICVYAATNMAGIEYASFQDKGANLYSTNGDTNGSNLSATAGVQTTHTAGVHFTAFPISITEYIGLYYSSGTLERSGIGSVAYRIGDNIPCTNAEFTGSGQTPSILATIEAAAGGAIPLLVGGGMGQTMGSNCNLMTG